MTQVRPAACGLAKNADREEDRKIFLPFFFLRGMLKIFTLINSFYPMMYLLSVYIYIYSSRVYVNNHWLRAPCEKKYILTFVIIEGLKITKINESCKTHENKSIV